MLRATEGLSCISGEKPAASFTKVHKKRSFPLPFPTQKNLVSAPHRAERTAGTSGILWSTNTSHSARPKFHSPASIWIWRDGELFMLHCLRENRYNLRLWSSLAVGGQRNTQLYRDSISSGPQHTKVTATTAPADRTRAHRSTSAAPQHRITSPAAQPTRAWG